MVLMEQDTHVVMMFVYLVLDVALAMQILLQQSNVMTTRLSAPQIIQNHPLLFQQYTIMKPRDPRSLQLLIQNSHVYMPSVAGGLYVNHQRERAAGVTMIAKIMMIVVMIMATHVSARHLSLRRNQQLSLPFC